MRTQRARALGSCNTPAFSAQVCGNSKNGMQDGAWIGTTCTTWRSELSNDDADAPGSVPRGRVVQLNGVNQFSEAFAASIREFESPECICGALSLAHALVLERAVDDRAFESVETVAMLMRTALSDGSLLIATRDVMCYIRDARRVYMAEHAGDFTTASERHGYMCAWAANYELGDYLASRPRSAHRSAHCDTTSRGIVFLRFNQWPERGDATHEEALRLASDEARFGGEQLGDKASVVLELGASRFIVQDFTTKRMDDDRAATVSAVAAAGGASDAAALCRHGELLTLGEWFDRRRAGRTRPAAPPPIFILDLNGHFSAAVALAPPPGPGAASERTLLLVNTTDAAYIAVPAVAAAFDIAFSV